VSNLAVSLDGSASSDPDGTVAAYAWDFGDGQTGTGRTTTHSYGAAGTYTVKLTVTDNAGASGSVTHPVTVTAPPAGSALASDAFGRTVSGGWGSADVGGAWTILGTAANASVGGGTGSLTAAKGAGIYADLGISAQDVAVQADVATSAAPSGGGTYVNVAGRNVGGNQYNAQLWFASGGSVWLSLLKESGGVETDLGDYQLPGTYAVGQAITVRLDLSGSSPTTLHAKAWTAGTTEPAAWQLTVTDGDATLQKAGGLEVQLYTSSSATATQTIRVDNLWAGPAGTKPQ
jgi:PKD repeat protein